MISKEKGALVECIFIELEEFLNKSFENDENNLKIAKIKLEKAIEEFIQIKETYEGVSNKRWKN